MIPAVVFWVNALLAAIFWCAYVCLSPLFVDYKLMVTSLLLIGLYQNLFPSVQTKRIKSKICSGFFSVINWHFLAVSHSLYKKIDKESRRHQMETRFPMGQTTTSAQANPPPPSYDEVCTV